MSRPPDPPVRVRPPDLGSRPRLLHNLLGTLAPARDFLEEWRCRLGLPRTFTLLPSSSSLLSLLPPPSSLPPLSPLLPPLLRPLPPLPSPMPPLPPAFSLLFSCLLPPPSSSSLLCPSSSLLPPPSLYTKFYSYTNLYSHVIKIYHFSLTHLCK